MNKQSVSLLDLVLMISEAVDLVSSEVADHHKRVSVVALALGREAGLDDSRLRELALAGALHDVGGLAVRDRLRFLEFETRNTEEHCRMGASLLETYPPFDRIARFVRHHHRRWDSGPDPSVPLESYILHLADRVAVLIRPGWDILGQADCILARIRSEREHMFAPEAVAALNAAAIRENFWFDAAEPHAERNLTEGLDWPCFAPDSEQLRELTLLFRRLIDFRSPFTATHSAGVARTAGQLAELAGYGREACDRMTLAGNLHDIGKLSVPPELLDKPGALTPSETNTLRSHAYQTHRILDHLPGLGDIRQWAGLHHEKLDGSGYPFHLKGDRIPNEARILAVADIFTALAEDRPYRPGLPGKRVQEILQGMADRGALDREVVHMAGRHAEAILEDQRIAHKTAVVEYAALRAQSALA